MSMIDNPLETPEARAEIHQLKTNLNSGHIIDLPRLMNWILGNKEDHPTARRIEKVIPPNYKV